MGLFQILDNCGGLGAIINIVKSGLFPILQIGVPILLLIFGSIDLGKAVMSSDEKQIKEATSKLMKRAIAAVVFFLIPTLVTFIMNILASNSNGEVTGTANWADCWKNPLGNAGSGGSGENR